MGNFLQILSSSPRPTQNPLLQSNGSKLREYYCSYRSICENFVISIPQYIQIFGFDVKSFQVWDTNNQGFLNAFQIFTGLIVFSKVPFEEKIRFLYEIYDLNEEGFLDYEGILFLVSIITQAIFKLYALYQSLSIKQEQIKAYLDDYFPDSVQFKCEQFISWAYRTYQVPKLFSIIGRQFNPKVKDHSLDEYQPKSNNKDSNFINPQSSQQNIPRKYKMKVKMDNRFITMLKNNRIIQECQDKTTNFNPAMEWIYGITINKVINPQPLHYQCGSNKKTSNQRLIYISGKNIIMLYAKLNKQKIYCKHQMAVSTLAIAQTNKDIVASGQYGSNPEIHIWNLKTLQTLTVFPRVHKFSINFIKFLNNDKLLVIVAQRKQSPIVIINIATKQKVLSTYLQNPVLSIIQLKFNHTHKNLDKHQKQEHSSNNLTNNSMVKDEKLQNLFYIFLNNSIVICHKQNSSQSYQMTFKKASSTSMNKQFIIKYSLLLENNVAGNETILILDMNNSFWIWDPTNKQFEIVRYLNMKDQQIQILGLYKCENQQNKFYILFSDRIEFCKLIRKNRNKEKALLYQLSQNEGYDSSNPTIQLLQQINQIPTELYNGRLIQLIETDTKTVIVVSEMGDIIKIDNFKKFSLDQEQQSSKRMRAAELSFFSNKRRKNNNIFANQNSYNDGNYNKFERKEQERDEQDKQNEEQNKPQIITTYQKYYQIFKLQKINGACLILSEEGQPNPLQYYENSIQDKLEYNLLICCNNLLYLIDQKDKQLLKFQVLEHNIVQICSYENLCALSTDNKTLLIMKNGQILEKKRHLNNKNFLLQKNVHDSDQNNTTIHHHNHQENKSSASSWSINAIKLTKQFLILATSEQYIQIYSKIGGSYFQNEPKKIKMEAGIPIHISSTAAKKAFLVMTQEKLILKLDLEAKDKNMVYSAKELNCDSLVTFYPQNIVKLPILFSGVKSYYLLAQPNGEIYFWNSLSHILTEESSYSVLSGHSSSLSLLIFRNTTNGFISIGSEDCQIISWDNKQTILQDEDEQKDESCNKEEEEKNQLKNKKTENMRKYISGINLKRYREEIKYLKDFVPEFNQLKDSKVQILAKDPQHYRQFRNIINDIVVPHNLQAYEPLFDTNHITGMKDKDKIEEDKNLYIQYEYIFGFNSEQIRQSLFYAHKYSLAEKKKENLIINNQIQAIEAQQNHFKFVKQKLEPLDKIHKQCARQFIYFTGRVCVVSCPFSKKQRFYNYHCNKVTCLAVHPSKNIICSAQLTNKKAIIHVWDSRSLTLLEQIQTNHSSFISKLKFSFDGEHILSLGGFQSSQSLQVHEWMIPKSIAFRRIDNVEVYDIQWNPYENNEIAVCGNNILSIYKISNKTLVKHEQCVPKNQEDFTCMVYTSNIYGDKIQSDIILGNNLGDLSMFICGKYIKCKSRAHSLSINCLRMCQLFKYKTILISAGEDNLVKLWDTKFNEIGRISTVERRIQAMAPQSIDIYHCLESKKGDKFSEQNQSLQDQALLLIGTRGGSIIEVKISEQYHGLKKYNDQSVQKNEKISQKNSNQQFHELINFNTIEQFSSLPSSSNKQFNFDIRDNLMVTYNVKYAHFTLWNLAKGHPIKEVKLSGYPSVLKFSSTNFLAVGYIDGRIQFYEFLSDQSKVLREQKIVLSNDEYPTKIVFSSGDIRIAVVSHHKQILDGFTSSNFFQQYDSESGITTSSKIIIYENLLSINNGNSNIMLGSLMIQNESQKFHKFTIQNSTPFSHINWLQFSSYDPYNNQQEKRKNSDIISFSYSKSLLICYTKYDYTRIDNSNKNKIITQINGPNKQTYKFVVYDLIKKKQKQINGDDFDALDFSPSIKALYRYYPELGEDTLNQQNQRRIVHPKVKLLNQQQKNNVSKHGKSNSESKNDLLCMPFTQMTQFDEFTLLGTVDGEIYIVKSANFYAEPGSQDTQYVPVKSIRCTDSPITKMIVANNHLYVSSKESSSIFKFILKKQGSKKQNSKMRSKKEFGKFSENNESSQKNIYENFFEKLAMKTKKVFPMRQFFYEWKSNAEQTTQNLMTKKGDEGLMVNQQKIVQNNQNNLIELEIKHILGRSAFLHKNNLFMDLKKNIVSYSGCNLCLNYYDQITKKFKQSFIKPDSSLFSTNPEISTIYLANNKQTLYIGTNQKNCQIIIWDISTKTNLDQMIFTNYISVLHFKISQTEKHGVVLAVHKSGRKALLFINIKLKKILACFTLSDQQIINDFIFFPKEEYAFLVCGINYIAQWTYQSQLLNQREYMIENPKDFIDLLHKSNEIEQKIFYSVIFINKIAITSCSDGYLYLWNDRNLIKKQNAHPKAEILSLFVSQNSYVFTSGAVDGKAIVWQLGSNFVIQKVFEFNTYDGKQSILSAKFHIQSVCIGQNDIILGTKSGDIYKFTWSYEAQMQKNSQISKQKAYQYSIVLSAFDDDEINSCSFNISSQKLFVLTQSGVISVFNLQTYEKINQQRMTIGNTRIVKMLTSKLSNKIFIVLKKGIEIYQYEQNQKSGSKKANKFKKTKQSLKYTSSQIKAAVLSLNEKYMALLIAPNHLENSKIQIYDLSSVDGKSFYPLYKVLENIPQNIEIIDFSTDNGYLLYKNLDQDETIIDLTTKQIINLEDIQFQLQWHQEAKKTSGLIRNICSAYSDENKLQNVVQVMDHSILATDQMGSIRLFKQSPDESALGYYRVYLQHLNDVFIAILSSDCSTLVTVGKEDRSIIIWKIKNFTISA